jgi:hypothetical protein
VKRGITRRLAMGGLMIGLAMFVITASANAQSLARPTRVNVPFDFIVANKKLPSGEYLISRKQPTEGDLLLAITNKDNHVNTVSFTVPVQVLTPTDKGKLVFHRYGEQYFLSELWPAGATTGRVVAKSRAERELEKKAKQSTVSQKLKRNETVSVVINLD